LFVHDQPEGDEGVKADGIDEGVKAGRDDTWAEIAVRGASAAEEAEDNTEAEANVST
jgi:hypothetical protein